MRFAFVIDQNRCIGCHACTVACKEEHGVPIGVNRTWVKYIEKGAYPNSRRHFAVLRCNHCDDAPCIEICPTAALFRRANGIVDFDNERCIGCKSCMQACPYDALYIDPDKGTAAKCNFDASRVERGYKPACEVVCPTQAILSGDLDDPASAVSRVVAMQKVSVRKPEKGTRPKLYYVGVDGDLLQPTMMEPQAAHFWSEKQPGEDLYSLSSGNRRWSDAGAGREVYDVAHPAPWSGKIAAYLWSKSIAAGVLLVAALLSNLGYSDERMLLSVASPLLALGFLCITILLLVFDLQKPGRFYFLLTKPNPRSWLVLGGYILGLYGLAALLWLLLGITTKATSPPVVWAGAFLAVGSACYSAFLFAQAKGRELWQSPLFLWHLLVQAMVAGAAVLIIAALVLRGAFPLTAALANLLVVSLLLSLGMILGETLTTHGSEEVKRAADLLTTGALRGRFWLVAVGLGNCFPVVLLLWPGGSEAVIALASLCGVAGLWTFEDLWIKAGQAAPLS